MAHGGWNETPGGHGGGDPPDSPNQQIRKLMAVMNWSFPIGVYLAVRVRVHILLLGYAVYELFTTNDIYSSLRSLLVLFVSVLLHEFGHILACRRMGGHADEILMWPLGGLAYCAPPHRPWAHFVTVIWGPIVNLFLAAAAFVLLWLWQGKQSPVGLNPFSPWVWWSESISVELIAQVFVVNYILLLFNLLMPFYPLDGGRVLQTILWAKLGYGRGSYVTSIIGMFGAGAALLIGLITENSLLTMIAFFGMFESVQLNMRLKAEAMAGPAYEPLRYGESGPAPKLRSGLFARWVTARRERAQQASKQRKIAFEGEVDRILDKVRKQGIASLSRKEANLLKRATQQQKNRYG